MAGAQGCELPSPRSVEFVVESVMKVGLKSRRKLKDIVNEPHLQGNTTFGKNYVLRMKAKLSD